MNKFMWKIKELECCVCLENAEYIELSTTLFGSRMRTFCRRCMEIKTKGLIK